MDGMVGRRLREARRRLIAQQFVDYAVWALLACLVLFAIKRITAPGIPVAPALWAGVVAGSLALAAAGAICRWRSPKSVALALDGYARTKDRFLTVLALPRNEPGALLEAVERETSRYASTLSPREHLPVKIPVKKALWLLLPALGLGLWEGVQAWRADRLAPELTVAQDLLKQAQRAAEIEAKKDDVLREVAEHLQVAEEQLALSTEPLREALRALSDLEQALSSQSSLDAAEASALAEALAKIHAGLASNLRGQRNADSAKSVAQLDPAELAAALEQAARHLETRRLRELATLPGTMAKLQLGAMLGAWPGSGKDAGRQRLLTAFRDIRSGTGSANRDQAIEGREGAPGNENSPAYSADNAPPSGLPGTEKDLGRGEEIAREGEPRDSAAGSEDFVEGEIGEGASLIELFRAAGNDDPKARRAYRGAYQTAAPAALDAVSREQIPAGSRLLVRRYFEAIRPKE